jgi:hypothetical protein
MTIKQIVEERLRKDGFDGLCGGRACDGCGCILDDLFPCGQDFSECVPGHAKWGTFDGEQTWRIFAPPPVQSDQDADTDPHEKDESWAGIEPFQVNAERREFELAGNERE